MALPAVDCFADCHAGLPGAVLGGGPSLPGDLERLPPHTVLFGVNHHAAQVVDCDYLVFNDAVTADRVASLPGLKVSPLAHLSDIDLAGAWTGGLISTSSVTAAWFALHLGCAPVILCGMDCRQGDRNYFYQPPGAGFPGMSPGHLDLEKQLATWRTCLERCPHPHRLRAASGPLAGVFGEWDGYAVADPAGEGARDPGA